jgi:signal transduction histidine kinase
MRHYAVGMSVHDVERVEWALRERVEELTCLYGIARVTQKPDLNLDETLTAICELLPSAWQFSDIACARIVLDGREYVSANYAEPHYRQTVNLVTNDLVRGLVEVGYTGVVEGGEPFLEEEVSLTDMVGREISIHVERYETEAHKARLQEQLRHADRLATIGQLAAGVAHELNEPLPYILGFAQLAAKSPKLPKQAVKHMQKIVSLYFLESRLSAWDLTRNSASFSKCRSARSRWKSQSAWMTATFVFSMAIEYSTREHAVRRKEASAFIQRWTLPKYALWRKQ